MKKKERKEEKEEDLFVHAASEGGDAPQVTFVDDCLVAVAVAQVRPTGLSKSAGDRRYRRLLSVSPATIRSQKRLLS